MTTSLRQRVLDLEAFRCAVCKAARVPDTATDTEVVAAVRAETRWVRAALDLDDDASDAEVQALVRTRKQRRNKAGRRTP